MPGESDLHKRLKKEACHWLFRMGYRAVAAEVRLNPLGIIDAVGVGAFARHHNYLMLPRDLVQVCFVECKVTRSDFQRDLSHNGQLLLALTERHANLRRHTRRRRPLRQRIGLGKFDACLAQPMANIHYLLAPAQLIRKTELPRRWGLLSYGEGGISVVVKAAWQERSEPAQVEAAIARTLTCDIFRADQRAIFSVNRELFAQQQSLAQRIRAISPVVVPPGPPVTTPDITS